MEAQPEVYQRAITFSSQENLYKWLQSSPAPKTGQATSIVLKLTEIDLSPLVSTSGKRNPSNESAWALYQKDLEKLDRSLTRLPGLRHLTVIPPTSPPTLLKGLYTSFLDLIARRCPELRELILQDDQRVIAAAPSLTHIAKVTFTRDGHQLESRSSAGTRGRWQSDQDDCPDRPELRTAVIDPQL